MNPADRAVLILLASGEAEIYGTTGIEKLSAMLEKAATKNTAAHALRRLQAENTVTRLAFGEYRIEDEAFADWIRRRLAT
jgi:hypothetical protein